MQTAALSGIKDRVAGAVMGAFIGDALGMGIHWYYDLGELHRDYGDWIDTYRNPKPGRYHEALSAGEMTQSGYMLKLTAESLLRANGYDESDFCATFDRELLDKMDGTSKSGPGGYTCEAIKHVYKVRKTDQLPWGERTASRADSTEAIERAIAIAAFYATQSQSAVQHVTENTTLTQSDPLVVSMSAAFGSLLSLLIQGNKLDGDVGDKLMELNQKGALPFHGPPPQDGCGRLKPGMFPSPEPLFTPAACATAAADGHISIEPAYHAAVVYGQSCAAYKVLPGCYYLAARFHDNFELAVLHAINGGGHNTARGMLTGALVGAQVGLSGIPQRLLDGLHDQKHLLDVVNAISDLASKQ